MLKEITVSAKTVDLAVEEGAEKLGYGTDKVSFEVIEEGRKGILGIGSTNARVRVYHEETPTEKAFAFINTILTDMGIEATASVSEENEEGALITVNGDNLGILIGKHGDMLDSLQYLATLAANNGEKNFYRITVDIEGYREKRIEALRSLARRMADRVLKTRRSYTLEHMNAYERRIIHSEVQTIDGVTTYSVGQDNDRRIVISLDKKK